MERPEARDSYEIEQAIIAARAFVGAYIAGNCQAINQRAATADEGGCSSPSGVAATTHNSGDPGRARLSAEALRTKRPDRHRRQRVHGPSHLQQRVTSLHRMITAAVEHSVLGVLEHPREGASSLEGRLQFALCGPYLPLVERHAPVDASDPRSTVHPYRSASVRRDTAVIESAVDLYSRRRW